MVRRLIALSARRFAWPRGWPAGLRLAAAKAAIVLVPSYSAAWLTDKMVYVVPTLAAAGIIAAQISFESDTQRRTDDDGDGDSEGDDPDADPESHDLTTGHTDT